MSRSIRAGSPYVPDLPPGTVCGYRVHEPYEPEAGHRSTRAVDAANSLREFKEMVARVHDAGIDVVLDVV